MTNEISIRDLGDIILFEETRDDGKDHLATFEKNNIDFVFDSGKGEIKIISDKEHIIFSYNSVVLPVSASIDELKASVTNMLLSGTVTLPQATFPYKSYVAILRQVNSLAPTEDCVLVNTIGTMTIIRISAGVYKIACPQFVYNKTVVISPTFYFKGIGSGFAYYDGATSVMIYTKNESGNFEDLNQILWNTIEVRVYN